MSFEDISPSNNDNSLLEARLRKIVDGIASLVEANATARRRDSEHKSVAQAQQQQLATLVIKLQSILALFEQSTASSSLNLTPDTIDSTLTVLVNKIKFHILAGQQAEKERLKKMQQLAADFAKLK